MRELPDLMLSYGIKLKERGNRYECLCPAHDDHNPSMSVYRNGDGGCLNRGGRGIVSPLDRVAA